jgi:hypothetical protein
MTLSPGATVFAALGCFAAAWLHWLIFMAIAEAIRLFVNIAYDVHQLKQLKENK